MKRDGRQWVVHVIKREGFDKIRTLQTGGCRRSAVILITKRFLTQPLDGQGFHSLPQESPELALRHSLIGLFNYDPCVKPCCHSCFNCLFEALRVVGLFFDVCVQQIDARGRIAVDPIHLCSQTDSALPKFVFDKFTRQQVVLRGLELLRLHIRHFQTGTLSLARKHGVKRCRRTLPDSFAKTPHLERLECVVFHSN